MSDRIDILLVEDNPDDAALILEMLEESERKHLPFEDLTYSVRQAEYLKDAFAILAKEEIDVVLLDLNLPDATDLSGITQLAEKGIEPPIIILTGLSDDRKAVEAIRRGAQEFLSKDTLSPEILTRSIMHSLERQKFLLMLKNLALVDELTRLLNRRGFLQSVDTRLRLAEREQRRCMVAFSDLNRLKAINDTYGHSEGDEALVAAANVLKRAFRSSDLVARIGGDEFAAFSYVINDGDSVEILGRINGRKMELCDQFNSRSGKDWELSISTGLILFDPWKEPYDFEKLLMEADQAMYVEKERNRTIRPKESY